MNKPIYAYVTHFSIVWGVTLAFLTLMEWRALDREPVKHEILSPFIERQVSVSLRDSAVGDIPQDLSQQARTNSIEDLQYNVSIDFNGPLFLAAFFGPILLFQGLGLLQARIKARLEKTK